MLKELTEKYPDKKELPYFLIDGKYGFDQEDFRDPWMRLGGCGAVTACDTCIYLDLYFGTHFYPYPLYADEGGVLRRIGPTRRDYIAFSRIMKPYLRPRHTGINTLALYIDGFQAFLDQSERQTAGKKSGPLTEEKSGEGKKQGRALKLSGFSGEETPESAMRAVCREIGNGLPVPCLTLRHKNPVFDDFEWHWFLLTGYQILKERFLVKAVSYGKWLWMDLAALWDTGFEEKGGLVLFHLE